MSTRSVRIITLFRTAALLSGLLFIVVTVGVYNAFGIYQKSLSQEAFASTINQSAYRLTSLTGDYLLYRENRARQQWISVHKSLAITLRQRITLELAEGNADDDVIAEIMALNDRMGKLFALTVKHYELDNNPDASTHESHTRGDRFASQVFSASHQITSKADLILQQSRETVRQFGRWAWAIIVTGILLLIVFTISVWLFFHRRIAIPIQKLRDDIGIFQGDKLSGYVRSVNNDEIGYVANEFNRIGESLRQSMVSRDELTQEVAEHIIAKEKLQIATLLLEESQKIAKVGGWQLEIASGDLFWTDETYHIHDTTPSEFNPTVDAGVGYFLPKSRQIISDALDAAIKDGVGYDLELETHTTKGRRIDVRTTCSVTQENGKSTKLSGIFQDITEQKQIRNKLEQANINLEISNAELGREVIERKRAERENLILAMKDQLTGLSNRREFEQRMAQSFELAKREKKSLAMMMLDLDKFKPVNDTYGHPVGDELLQMVSAILIKYSRSSDVVARLGGDEFVMLMVHPEGEQGVAQSAQRIIDEVAKPMDIQGHKINIGVSIGVAIYPRDASSESDLVRKSDMALYAAKKAKKSQVLFYHPEMNNA